MKTIWCCSECAEGVSLATMPQWRQAWTQDETGNAIPVMTCPHILATQGTPGRQWMVRV